jgi:hypothetical protein
MSYKQLNSRINLAPAAMFAVVCMLAASAIGQITVTSPTNNSSVAMPVQLTAAFAGCGGASSAFGYSVGSSPFITWGKTDTQINSTDYRLTPGTYVIHFKGWTGSTLCETNINVTVTGPSTTTASSIEDQPNSDWTWVFDTGTSGSASGSTSLVSGSPCQDSQCREFTMTYTDGGGMRGSISFGSDPTHAATHFVYDTYIYFDSTKDVQNIELDTNQVWDASNDVLIYGLQCANDGKWQYTTKVSGSAHWTDSMVACPVPSTKWAATAWHHVQLAVHRDSSGNAYYDSVTLDGTTTNFTGADGNSSFALDWAAGDLLLNFQLDGLGANGSITAYADGLTEIWW